MLEVFQNKKKLESPPSKDAAAVINIITVVTGISMHTWKFLEVKTSSLYKMFKI